MAAEPQSAWLLEQKAARHEPVPRFREEVRTLMDERFHVTLLSLPMLTLVLFTALPIAFMILIAFTNFDSTHQPPGQLFTWTGLTNVTDVFLGNEVKTRTFFGILGWTLVWAVLATFTNYILGMLLAVVINHRVVRLKKLWRTCFGHRHCGAAVRQPAADLAGAGAAGSRQRGADGAWLD